MTAEPRAIVPRYMRRPPEVLIRVAQKEAPMKLRTALTIVELEGPHEERGGYAGRAARLVDAHLTDEERAELRSLWKPEPPGSVRRPQREYVMRFQRVRERLIREGTL